jgi:sec-independent protein translocase protein TatA
MPFGGFHPVWLLLLLVIVLVIFGPGKLPELGGAVGRAIQEFRKASTELKDEVTRSANTEPSSSSSPPAPSGAAEPPKSQAETKG